MIKITYKEKGYDAKAKTYDEQTELSSIGYDIKEILDKGSEILGVYLSNIK